MSRWSFSSRSRLKLLTSFPAISRAPDGEERPKRKALQAHSIAGLMGSRSGSRATAAITAQAERVSCHCSFFLCPPSFLLLTSASSFTLSLLLSLVLPVSCKNGQQLDHKTRTQHDTLLLTGSSTQQRRARASARRDHESKARASETAEDRIRRPAKGGCEREISSQTRYVSLLCFTSQWLTWLRARRRSTRRRV